MGFHSPTQVQSIPVDIKKETQKRILQDKIDALAEVESKLDKEIKLKQKKQEVFLGASIEVDSKTQELEDLKAQLVTLNKDLKKGREELVKFNGLTSKIAELKKDLDSKETKIKELGDLDAKIASKHAEIAELALNDKLESEKYLKNISKLVKERDIEEAKLKDVFEAIKVASLELTKCNDELKKTKEVLEKTTESLKDLKEKETSMLKQYSDKKQEAVSELTTVLAGLKDDFDAECARKTKSLELKEGEISRKMSILESKRTQLLEAKQNLEKHFNKTVNIII